MKGMHGSRRQKEIMWFRPASKQAWELGKKKISTLTNPLRFQQPSFQTPRPSISPSFTVAMTSSLHGQALNASRAAIREAMADHPVDEDSAELGELQEVNMEAQAEGIKTVFSDPKNFNVKVGDYPFRFSSTWIISFLPPSILCIPHGPSGSTLLLQRIVIFPKPPFPCRPRLPCRRLLALLLLKAGWKISNASLALIALKSFGGEFHLLIYFHATQWPHVPRLYNNIIPPSQLPQKANYYLFKVSCALLGILCLLNGEQRRESFQHGKTKQTRMVVNGVFSCPRIKTGQT